MFDTFNLTDKRYSAYINHQTHILTWLIKLNALSVTHIPSLSKNHAISYGEKPQTQKKTHKKKSRNATMFRLICRILTGTSQNTPIWSKFLIVINEEVLCISYCSSIKYFDHISRYGKVFKTILQCLIVASFPLFIVCFCLFSFNFHYFIGKILRRCFKD